MFLRRSISSSSSSSLFQQGLSSALPRVPVSSCLLSVAPLLRTQRMMQSASSAAASSVPGPSVSSNWFESVRTRQQPQQQQHEQEQQQPVSASSSATPPKWFQTLCEDLYFRRDTSASSKSSANKTGDASVEEEDFDEAARTAGEVMKLDFDEQQQQGGRGSDGGDDDMAENNNDGGDAQAPVVDPFLWLEFNILPEEEYRFERFEFPARTTPFTSPEIQQLLCGEPQQQQQLQQQQRRMMCCFATAYKFPDRRQLPVTVGTEPCFLWVDPSSASSSSSSCSSSPQQQQAVVYIQLSKDFPPALWLPVKGTARAVRRVLAEFATNSALHRDRHQPMWQRRFDNAVHTIRRQQLPRDKMNADKPGDVLRFLAFAATKESYDAKQVREYHNSQEFFLGEYADPETELQMRCDLCPVLFATPIFRAKVNLSEPEHTPTTDGPGVATSLYRTVFSKSLLLVQVHLATEVKLAPLDHDAFRMLWTDSAKAPPSRVPVFVRAIWPDNDKMCGKGAGIVRNINRSFGTEFAHDVPVDVVLALLYLAHWAKKPQDLLGVHGMRKRLLQLEKALLLHGNQSGADDSELFSSVPNLLSAGQHQQQQHSSSSSSSSSDVDDDHKNGHDVNMSAMAKKSKKKVGDGSIYPGTAEIPCPHYTFEERIGMHLQYAAHLGDPLARDAILHFLYSSASSNSSAIRLGCGKAALELGDKELFKRVAQAEPEGSRTQRLLTTLVVKRKKRDLLEPEPRLSDDQFEFAAPLWSGSSRIDPSTKDGAAYLARLQARGAAGVHKGYAKAAKKPDEQQS